jgi:hypothetical protein
MNTVKLNAVSKYSAYAQTPQTSSLEFALLERVGENEFTEIHYKVKCREYFGDALVAAHLNQPMPPIYGFQLNSKRMTIDETLFSLFLDADNYDYFIQRLPVLNRIEKKMGISLTQFFNVKNDLNNNYKIVSVGDKKWSSSPLLISIYTLILRSFSYKTNRRTFKTHIKDLLNNYSGNDKATFLEITSKINLEHLLLNIDEVLKDNPLTGIDDLDFKLKISENNDPFKARYNETYLNYYYKNIKYTVTWSISTNHAQHGILSFINNLKILKLGNNVPNNSIGSQWALNYYLLINKQ